MESLISQINKDKMNTICFDCGAENPNFVSINNGIFLCNQCASVHMSFPQGISIIENNDLYSLSEKELKFLAEGGNTSLNDFILDEYPKLENYSQKLLYKTRAMDYYRKRLYYYVYGGIEPRRPSQIVGCQLIPENYYNQNTYIKHIPKKYEPKTKTYKPEEHIKSRKFNINPNNYQNDEEEFFRDPFMNEAKFRNEGDLFQKFFGKDFFGMDDDDFLNFGEQKNMNQTQFIPRNKYQYQERPKNEYINSYNNTNNNNYDNKYNNIKGNELHNNLSKSTYPGVYHHKIQPRPLTATNPIFVPSRKHKYIKKEQENNDNPNIINENIQKEGASDPMKYMKSNNRDQYSQKDIKENDKENPKQINIYDNNKINNNERKSYDPFKRRDSTDLITFPGMEKSNLLQNKRKPKIHEIPAEFSKQASGLGQIADAINENDDESISSKNSISDSEKIQDENDLDSSAELKKIPENNSHKFNDNNDSKDEPVTFKNSIRNKYKQRKSQIGSDKKKEEEEKLKERPKPFNNNIYENKYNDSSNKKIDKSEKNNIKKKSSKKINDFKKKKSSNLNNENGTNPSINKSYARRLSKMNITSINWNINQLGDINTYPEVMDVEE